MCESERTQWLLSMPACADINGAMMSAHAGVMPFMTSEKHEDVTKAREARDNKDSHAVLGFLQECIPFVPDPYL